MSRREKKRRKVFNLYNFAVLICLVIIFGALIILFEQDSKMLPDELKEKYAYTKEFISTKFQELTSSKNKNTNINNNTNIYTNNVQNRNSNTNTNNTNSNATNNNSYVNNQNNNTTVNSTSEINESAARLVAAQKFRELGETSISENALSIMKIQRQQEEYYYISSSVNSLEIKISTGQITRINSVPVE